MCFSFYFFWLCHTACYITSDVLQSETILWSDSSVIHTLYMDEVPTSANSLRQADRKKRVQKKANETPSSGAAKEWRDLWIFNLTEASTSQTWRLFVVNLLCSGFDFNLVFVWFARHNGCILHQCTSVLETITKTQTHRTMTDSNVCVIPEYKAFSPRYCCCCSLFIFRHFFHIYCWFLKRTTSSLLLSNLLVLFVSCLRDVIVIPDVKYDRCDTNWI